MVVELIWSSGDHNCLQCESNGAVRAAGPRLPARDRKAPLRDRPPRLYPGHVEHDDPARSQQVRALRALHPRLQRDPGQRGARFRPARQPHEGGPRLRRGLHQLLLRLLRRVHAGLPHGGHHQQAGPLPGTPLGDREGPHDLHLLRRGLPARPQCLRRKGREGHLRPRPRRPQLGEPLREGALRQRVHPLARPPDHPAHPQERQARGGRAGTRRSTTSPTN